VTDMKPEATESLSRLHAAIAGRAEEVAAAMPVSEVLVGNLLEAFPILMWGYDTGRRAVVSEPEV